MSVHYIDSALVKPSCSKKKNKTKQKKLTTSSCSDQVSYNQNSNILRVNYWKLSYSLFFEGVQSGEAQSPAGASAGTQTDPGLLSWD